MRALAKQPKPYDGRPQIYKNSRRPGVNPVFAMHFSLRTAAVFAILAAVISNAAASPSSGGHLENRCHLTNGVCNPYTPATCPICCFPEQCSKCSATFDCVISIVLTADVPCYSRETLRGRLRCLRVESLMSLILPSPRLHPIGESMVWLPYIIISTKPHGKTHKT